MNALERYVVFETVEIMAEAADKLNQQIRELQALLQEAAETQAKAARALNVNSK